MAYWTLTETSQSRGIYLYLVDADEERLSKPVTSISWAGAKPSENILLQLQGMEQTIDLTFLMFDDGTNKAFGTGATGTTIEQQRTWLRDKVFIGTDLTNSQRLSMKHTISGGPHGTIAGVLTDVMYHNKSTDPMSLSVDIRFTTGTQYI